MLVREEIGRALRTCRIVHGVDVLAMIEGLELALRRVRDGASVATDFADKPPRRRVADCLEVVAVRCQVSVRDLISARRSQYCARPRHLVMWLARQVTTASLPSIGNLIGVRHHTTVMHGIRRVEQLREADPEFKALCDRCLSDLC